MTDVTEPFGGAKSSYYAAFREAPRERDKVGLSIIANKLSEFKEPIDIVEIGAGWGNLALLLQNKFPECKVSGIEIDPSCVEAWKNDATLKKVPIINENILEKKINRQWHVALTVAVTLMYPQAEFYRFMEAIAQLIKIGGYYVGWELFQEVDQDLEMNEIVEEMNFCPHSVRSFRYVRSVLEKTGFEDVRYMPFEMPIDLAPVNNTVPRSGRSSDIEQPHLISHTVNTDNGRYCFRGGLYQPWCHVVAKKTSEIKPKYG